MRLVMLDRAMHSLCLKLLVSICLLFSGVGAVTHDYTHLTRVTADQARAHGGKETAPGVVGCLTCLAFSAFAAALPSVSGLAAIAAFAVRVPRPPRRRGPRRALVFFRSRAPPSSFLSPA